MRPNKVGVEGLMLRSSSFATAGSLPLAPLSIISGVLIASFTSNVGHWMPLPAKPTPIGLLHSFQNLSTKRAVLKLIKAHTDPFQTVQGFTAGLAYA